MLENHWYIACRSRQLSRRPRPIQVFNRHLVLFRDDDGRAACVEDRCAHRNMPLSRGRVVDGCLQCPYHGWRYGGDGRVRRIPAMLGCRESQHTLRIPSYPVVEQDGYLWLSLAEEPAMPAPLRFPHLGLPGWSSFHVRTRMPASVDLCLENFLDCPHTGFVHGGWFRSPATRPLKAVVRPRSDGAEAEFFDEPQNDSLAWRLLAPREPVRHIDRFVAPATSWVEYIAADSYHYSIVSSCTPITDTETEVNTVFSLRHGRITPLVKLFLQPFTRFILYQDKVALRQLQANIDRFGGESFRVIPQDLLLPHIRRWRAALAQGRLPSETGGEREADIVI